MKTYFILCFAAFCVLISCNTTKHQVVSTMPQLESLVNSKSFEIESQQAIPTLTNSISQLSTGNLLGNGSTSSQINLIGNDNFLKFKGDTVASFLPYYGEQQVGSDFFTGEVAIEFDGIPEEYKTSINEKDIVIEFKINAKERSERYDVYIKLYPSNTSLIRVISNKRTPISYRGRIVKFSGSE